MFNMTIQYSRYTKSDTDWYNDRVMGEGQGQFAKILLEGNDIGLYLDEVEEIQELIDRLELMKTELAKAKTITKTNPKEEITK